MIKNNATISITSYQNDGENSDTSEIITVGDFSKKNDHFEISYDETEATGYEGCVTKLSVFDSRKIIMNRTGNFFSNLIIDKEKKHFCQYGTPYGEMIVGITTKEITSDLDNDGGKVNFKYVIDINSSYVGDFDVTIDVKKQGDNTL